MICHNLGHPSQRASSLAFVILATLTTPRANELIQYTHSQNSTTKEIKLDQFDYIKKFRIITHKDLQGRKNDDERNADDDETCFPVQPSNRL